MYTFHDIVVVPWRRGEPPPDHAHPQRLGALLNERTETLSAGSRLSCVVRRLFSAPSLPFNPETRRKIAPQAFAPGTVYISTAAGSVSP